MSNDRERLGLPDNTLVSITGPQAVSFSYMNHKGLFRRRKVVMLGIYWGTNKWYSTPQWLVKGKDLEKDAIRTFALRNIADVQPIEDTNG